MVANERPGRAQVLRQRAGATRWEMAFRRPPESIRPYVRQYCGYAETTPGPFRRLEFATPQLVVIFEFGPPIRLVDPRDHLSTRYPRGFTAGVGDSFSITEHDGFQEGMEVTFTPIGGRLFFDFPMAELANQVVGLEDVLAPDERDISARLRDAGSWDARFDLLDRFVADRVARARTHPRAGIATWAMERIAKSGGRVDIRGLARELGYSQKHLISLFRDQVGLPPKLIARLVRFDCVLQHLKQGEPGSWAEIAARYGYYDQAHLVRDVRQFTGSTPTGARAMVADFPDLAVAAV
jgi:AraC-like DNA-binding protein